MIYLGGCTETQLLAFKANALFWGHGMDKAVENVMTLEEMMQLISGWGGRIEISKIRRVFDEARFPN